jgi:hypothetical protein
MVSSLLGFRYVEGFNLPSIVVTTLGGPTPFSAVENSRAGTISHSTAGRPSVVASSARFFSDGAVTRALLATSSR